MNAHVQRFMNNYSETMTHPPVPIHACTRASNKGQPMDTFWFDTSPLVSYYPNNSGTSEQQSYIVGAGLY